MSMATDAQRELKPEQAILYLKGWRVEEEPGGHRLRFVDHFANRNDDFGLHATSARAWEIAGLLTRRAPAIAATSNA